MKYLFLLLCLLSAPAMASDATQIAGNSGKIIGAAPACGIAAARIAKTDQTTRTAIAQRSTGENDKKASILLYESATARAAELQKSGDGEDCEDIKRTFDMLEKYSGAMGFALPR